MEPGKREIQTITPATDENPEMTTAELAICVALLLLSVFVILAFAYTLFVCGITASAFISTYANNTTGVLP